MTLERCENLFENTSVRSPLIEPAAIALGGRESSSVEVRSPRAAFMDDAVIGELWPVKFVHFRQPPMVTYSKTTANRL